MQQHHPLLSLAHLLSHPHSPLKPEEKPPVVLVRALRQTIAQTGALASLARNRDNLARALKDDTGEAGWAEEWQRAMDDLERAWEGKDERESNRGADEALGKGEERLLCGLAEAIFADPARAGDLFASTILTRPPSSDDADDAAFFAAPLRLLAAGLGPRGVLRFAESFCVSLLSSSSGNSEADPRMVEETFVRFMDELAALGLDVPAAKGSGHLASSAPSLLGFDKGVESLLLEALVTKVEEASDACLPAAQQQPQSWLGGRTERVAPDTSTWRNTLSSAFWTPSSSSSISSTSSDGYTWSQRPSQPLPSNTGRRRISGPLATIRSLPPSTSSLHTKLPSPPFVRLATSLLFHLSRPVSSANISTPLSIALSQALLTRHFPRATHPREHRRVALLFVVRWYSFGVLARVVGSPEHQARLAPAGMALEVTSATSAEPHSPSASLLFPLSKVDGVSSVLFNDVWISSDGRTRLAGLHQTIHRALVQAAGFGGASSAASPLSKEEQEMRSAAERVVRSFGVNAGLALELEGEDEVGEQMASSTLQTPGSLQHEEDRHKGDTLRVFQLTQVEWTSLLASFRSLMVTSVETEADLLQTSPSATTYDPPPEPSRSQPTAFHVGEQWRARQRQQKEVPATSKKRTETASMTADICTADEFDTLLAQLQTPAANALPRSSRRLVFVASTPEAQLVSFDLPATERAPAGDNDSSTVSSGLGAPQASCSSLYPFGRTPSASTPAYGTQAWAGSTGGDYFGLPSDVGGEGALAWEEMDLLYKALLALVHAGQFVSDSVPMPDLRVIFEQAASSEEDSLDFPLALLFRQASSLLSHVVSRRPDLATNNFTPLLSPMVSSLERTEATVIGERQLLSVRLDELAALRERTLLPRARMLLADMLDLRLRAFFALNVMASRGMEDLRAQLSRVQRSEVDLDAQGEIDAWLVESGSAEDLAEHGDRRLIAGCYLVERFVRKAADSRALLRSALFAREAALIDNFRSSHDLDVSGNRFLLPIGAVSNALLVVGETRARSPGSSLDAFALRVRARLTSFFLSELAPDLAFPPTPTWFEGNAHLLPSTSPELHPLLLPTEWPASLLRTFLLHPSPDAKLAALYELERLVLAALAAPNSAKLPAESLVPTATSSKLKGKGRSSSVQDGSSGFARPRLARMGSQSINRLTRAIESYPAVASPNFPVSSSSTLGSSAPSSTSSALLIPDAIRSLASYVWSGASPFTPVPSAPASAGVDGNRATSSFGEPATTDRLVDELGRLLRAHAMPTSGSTSLPAGVLGSVGIGASASGSLFQSLLVVALFVPGEVLAFRPEGKAFLDVSLAALTLRADLLDILLSRAKILISRASRDSEPSQQQEQGEARALLEICISAGSSDVRSGVAGELLARLDTESHRGSGLLG